MEGGARAKGGNQEDSVPETRGRGVERVKGTGCLESGPAEVSRAEVAVLSGEYWGPGEGVGSQCRPHCWASEEEGRSHEVLS